MRVRLIGLMAGLAAMLLATGAGVADVTIATVPVGNVGNLADSTGYGAVNYEFNIGTYEVTNAQYAEFLNAVATVGDPHSLYYPYMGGGYPLDTGGISRTGSGTGGDPWVYSTRANRGNHPVTWVSFWNACRFANWLHNGQGSGDTETGVYSLNGVTYPTNSTVTRNPGWKWAVTSEDEWYKAAYHMNDPGAPGGNYYVYPTGSDTPPTAEAPPGTDMTNGSANYRGPSGFVDPTYYTTEVGAYDAKPSDSPYGTFDQAGNVWEWNETIVDVSYRSLRGGSYYSSVPSLLVERADYDPSAGTRSTGFRVSQVPEPASMAVLAFGSIAILLRRRGRRR